MNKQLYSVYDCKAEVYGTPFFQRSRGEALRSWDTIANDEETDIGRFPSDFTLFELGEFDERTGKLVLHPTPVSCGVAIEFKKEKIRPVQPNAGNPSGPTAH